MSTTILFRPVGPKELELYVAYYKADRPHLSLDRDAPNTRTVEPPRLGKIIALPRVGGLHHRYARAA
jgi:hypothetical protein